MGAKEFFIKRMLMSGVKRGVQAGLVSYGALLTGWGVSVDEQALTAAIVAGAFALWSVVRNFLKHKVKVKIPLLTS